MSTRVPECIEVGRHVELRGRNWEIWIRRVVLALVALVPVAALFDVFGQEQRTTTAESATAVLSVTAPDRVRGGLLFTARYRVTAHTVIRDARLVLDPAWMDNMQVNSIVPQARSQTSREGALVLDLGRISAGRTWVTFIGYQVNPTDLGRRIEAVELDDGARQLLRVRRTIVVYP